MLPKAGHQKIVEGSDSKEEASIQGQYVQLLPITSRGHSSESTDNATSSQDYMALSPSSRSWEVPRNTITIDKVIGKGAFGQVAKGKAVGLPGKKGKTTVTVKLLKGRKITFTFPLVATQLVIFALLTGIKLSCVIKLDISQRDSKTC